MKRSCSVCFIRVCLHDVIGCFLQDLCFLSVNKIVAFTNLAWDIYIGPSEQCKTIKEQELTCKICVCVCV